MSRFWSSLVKQLKPYIPGEQPKMLNLIKLNTNENPYSPSPQVLAALKSEITESLRLYPDPNSDELKKAIALYCKVSTKQIFIGNGSDEVLAHAFQALLKQEKPLLFPDITYSFYPVYCGLYQIDFETIPLTEKFEINVEDYFRVNGGIIFPNPNAPTGHGLSLKSIENLLRKNTNSVVIVDEAYVDFGGETSIKLVNRYPNLLVIQTFSKSRSLAGLRVGFAIGNEDLIEALERVKNSFNSYPIDRLALKGAIAAINDQDYFEKTRQTIINTREKLVGELQQLNFEVLPSQANFVFIRHINYDAQEISQKLREKGIIVRYFSQHRIEQFLRITIGRENECEILIQALKEILTN